MTGHYLSVACSLLGIKKYNDTPSNIPNVDNALLQAKKAYISELASHIVDQCGLVDKACRKCV